MPQAAQPFNHLAARPPNFENFIYMTIKELLEHQQQSGHICLIKQGLFFRAYNQGVVLLSRLFGYQMWSGGDCLKIKWKDKTKMNMKTKSLLSALAVVVLSVSVGHAQSVERLLFDQQHPVINCEAMPASAYTTTTKGKTEDELKTGAANSQVYKRFAVSGKENSRGAKWSDAFTVCSGISGGGWRLPTQRELMLIWVLKKELMWGNADPLEEGSYWCATESGENLSWLMFFSNGTLYSFSRSTQAMVRCVRELE